MVLYPNKLPESERVCFGICIKSPAVSFDKSLAGQVSGVQVMSNSGQPGSGTSFRIRGSGSLKASNEPLYVIDGVATTSTEYSSIAEENESSSNILSSINPNDIESITVLKDAAAAALYGSRAANGVVVITTKSGKERIRNSGNKSRYHRETDLFPICHPKRKTDSSNR